MIKKFFRLFILVIFAITLTQCVTPRPDNVENICHIFRQYPKWFWATEKTKDKWGVPISVQMAIIYQESRFTADAKPPRTKLLWIIPWTRPSSAYGYSQALGTTWEHYKKQAGSYFASRDAFEDAVDFIGWYAARAKRKAWINPKDAYKLYLAYHEGIGGFRRKTYLKKRWLIRVARKVKGRAQLYQRQLHACEASLRHKPWYRFW